MRECRKRDRNLHEGAGHLDMHGGYLRAKEWDYDKWKHRPMKLQKEDWNFIQGSVIGIGALVAAALRDGTTAIGCNTATITYVVIMHNTIGDIYVALDNVASPRCYISWGASFDGKVHSVHDLDCVSGAH